MIHVKKLNAERCPTPQPTAAVGQGQPIELVSEQELSEMY